MPLCPDIQVCDLRMSSSTPFKIQNFRKIQTAIVDLTNFRILYVCNWKE